MNHDCLPIYMLLYIMMYIMLVYLMLFAALSNAVCLYYAFLFSSLPLIFANAFCFYALSWFIEKVVCLFQVLFSIMHSAFNLLVFHNYIFTSFFFH